MFITVFYNSKTLDIYWFRENIDTVEYLAAIHMMLYIQVHNPLSLNHRGQIFTHFATNNVRILHVAFVPCFCGQMYEYS